MAAWKILIISLLAAVALGGVGGILVGKYLVKRAKSPRQPVLTRRERILYSTCAALGAAFILFGVFFKLPAQQPDPNAGMMPGENPGVFDEGTAGGDVEIIVAEQATMDVAATN